MTALQLPAKSGEATGQHGQTALIGRAAELAVLERLFDSARQGTSAAIVVTGGPGVGKSALVTRAAEDAAGFTVLRVQGVKPESQLAYAGLHRLLIPLLGDLGQLPGEQRQALDAIFGRARGGPAPSPFLVGLASLTLLAEAATRAPVLCVVDDAQWIDPESLSTVAFVARRVFADRIAIICSAREPAEPDCTALDGLARLRIGALAPDDAMDHIVGDALQNFLAGRGSYGDALAAALAVAGKDLSRLGPHVVSDLVEAAVRASDLDTALAAFERLTVRAEAADTLWSRGLLARSRALLAPDDAAEALFTEAEGHLAEAGMAADEARAYLLHGEWLRRRRRRTDAIAPLSRALEMFSAMGVPALADRASIEIQAALAIPRAQAAGRLPGLTSQERQVAQMAAQGATNREIAAARYISESTVAYHLQKIYRKLDITSRRQLTRLLPGQAADCC